MNNSPRFGATDEEWLHFDFNLGLTADLLPCVSNPNAVISPNSKMKKVGKTPSLYNKQRQVAGMTHWTQHIATAKHVDKWRKEPDYGISLQTRKLRGGDIDVADPHPARKIVQFTEDFFGVEIPRRVRSNSGKCLLAFIVPGSFGKRSVHVEGGMVEFLATGNQFVAAGQHDSGVRYEWQGGMPDAFPEFTIEQADAWWAELCKRFGIAAPSKQSNTSRKRGEDLRLADDIPDRLDVLAWGKDGQAFIHCPFSHEHTMDSGESQTAYFPRGTGGYEQGKFVCLHAHCRERDQADFLDALGLRISEITALPADVQPGELAEASKHIAGLPWPKLKRNKAGLAQPTMSNLETVLSKPDWCGAAFRYDRFKGEILFQLGDEKWRPVNDIDFARLRSYFDRRGFMPVGREIIRDAASVVADNNSFDSAQDYLAAQKWDGKPRVETFLIEYFGVVDSPYSRAVARYIWTAGAGRVLVPGIKADMMAIFVGDQGIRKSSAIEAMNPEDDSFCEISFEEDEDKITRKLRGKLFSEVSELRGMMTRDMESNKAFLTRKADIMRELYKEFARPYPRRVVFIGTTNKEEFLADETGNRRMLPVEIRYAEIDAISRDRHQLWAEARDMFNQGGVHWEVEKLAKAEHDNYILRDSWEEDISAWLHRTSEITNIKPIDEEFIKANDIFRFALGMDSRSVKTGDQWRLGKCLRIMGYTCKRRLVDGGRMSVWIRK